MVAVQPSVLRVVYAARVRIVKRFIDATPDNHFAAGPYRRVTDSAKRHIHKTSRLSNCRSWDYICRRCSGKMVHDLIGSTPDHHFAARPHCGVIPSCVGRIAACW